MAQGKMLEHNIPPLVTTSPPGVLWFLIIFAYILVILINNSSLPSQFQTFPHVLTSLHDMILCCELSPFIFYTFFKFHINKLTVLCRTIEITTDLELKFPKSAVRVRIRNPPRSLFKMYKYLSLSIFKPQKTGLAPEPLHFPFPESHHIKLT
jgi:hypothetical protein